MNKKAEYKSAIRSRRLIREAFVDLIQEKTLEKITVTDIVNRADINRGTFYAHYKDARAVIAQIEDNIIKKMLEFLGEFQYKSFFQNPMPLLLKISKCLEEDLSFFRSLISSAGADQFLVKLKKNFVSYLQTDSDTPESIKKSPEFLIRIHFFAGGIINLYQVWFRGEMDSSLDEISLEVSKLIISNSPLFYK